MQPLFKIILNNYVICFIPDYEALNKYIDITIYRNGKLENWFKKQSLINMIYTLSTKETEYLCEWVFYTSDINTEKYNNEILTRLKLLRDV